MYAATGSVFVVGGWYWLGAGIRADHHRARRAMWVSAGLLVVVVALALVAVIFEAAWLVVVPAVVSVPLVRDVLEQLANRRLGARLDELDRTGPPRGVAADRVRVPSDVPPGPLRVTDVDPSGWEPDPVSRITGAWRASRGRSLAWPKAIGAFLYAYAASVVEDAVRRRLQRPATEPAAPPAEVPSLPTASRPVRSAYLWVFQDHQHDGIVSVVRALGSITYLRGGGTIADGHIIDVLRGGADALIESDPAEIERRLATFEWDVASENSMLCTDHVWKIALDRVLEHSDVVVMDATRFGSDNLGCEYELGAVIDRIRADRFVLVVGKRTDRDALDTALRRAWASMAADSPNREAGSGSIVLLRGDHLGEPEKLARVERVNGKEERLEVVNVRRAQERHALAEIMIASVA